MRAERRRELDAEPTLRMVEWVGGMPYATNRLQALREFELSPLAATWRDRLRTSRTQTLTTEFALQRETVYAILKSPVVEYVPHVKGALGDVPSYMRPFIAHLPTITLGVPAVLAVATYLSTARSSSA